MPCLPAGASSPDARTGVGSSTSTVAGPRASSAQSNNADPGGSADGFGHLRYECRQRIAGSSSTGTAAAPSSSAAHFYGTDNNARTRPESHMKREVGDSGEMVVATAAGDAAAATTSSSTAKPHTTSKKGCKATGSPSRNGKHQQKQREQAREVMSDGPSHEAIQTRLQSTAMARDTSNTSVASTRSLPPRITRGSRRKYIEASSPSSPSSEDPEGDQSRSLLKPPLPTPPTSTNKQKGKARQVDPDGGDATAHLSRSISPEPGAGAVNGNKIGNPPRSSGLSIRLTQSTKKRRSRRHGSKTAKVKRRKKQIEDSDDHDSIAHPSSSRMQSEAPSHASLGDTDNIKSGGAKLLKDEEESTSDSSLSTPLASSTFRSSRPAASMPQRLSAKSEPVSEAEVGDRANSPVESIDSLLNGTDNPSRAPTITTSRATSAEDGTLDEVASSRASVASEPVDVLRLPLLGGRSVSAIEGGDELSTGAQSTAMSSPADEIDRELGQVKKSIPAAPTVVKKPRGRPPKKRPLSETPGPQSDYTKNAVSASSQAANEPAFSGIKARYHATLQRERELIEAGTHPLYLQALAEYDEIKADKIAMLNNTLRVKEEAIRKAREAREKLIWDTWQDERRKLWHELLLGYTKKQRRLGLEKEVIEAELADPAGLFGTAKAILWPDRDPTRSFVYPPVVEPLIRVSIAAKPPQKGRTRSSNKSSDTVGKAFVCPINSKVACGISALSKDEIDLDLEAMGLSSSKQEDNWFHNAITEEEAEQKAEAQAVKTAKVDVDADKFPHEASVGETHSIRRVDQNAQMPPAPYPYPAPYDYTAWPPYPDPRYPTGPPYNPYYPIPPYPTTSSVAAAAAPQPGFHFPTASVSRDDRSRQEKQKPFAFPKSRQRDSLDGKSGHSRDDAILIDDEGLALAAGTSVQQGASRNSRVRENEEGQHPLQRNVSRHARQPTPANAEGSRPRPPYEGYQDPLRLPENAYQLEYEQQVRQQRGTAGEFPRGRPVYGYSPDPNVVGSPNAQEHPATFRERRTSNGEMGSRYAASPEEWAYESRSTRYRPYYDSTMNPRGVRDDPSAPGGYSPDWYVDRWGRPVDPYLPQAYYHNPGYAERVPESRYSGVSGDFPPAPPPREAYREEPRSRYRQYSAQPEELYHPSYVPPYPSYPRQAPHDLRLGGRGGSYATSSRHAATSTERERSLAGENPSDYQPRHR